MGTHYMAVSRHHTKTVTSNRDSAMISRVAAAEQLKQTIHLAADRVRNLLNNAMHTHCFCLLGSFQHLFQAGSGTQRVTANGWEFMLQPKNHESNTLTIVLPDNTMQGLKSPC